MFSWLRCDAPLLRSLAVLPVLGRGCDFVVVLGDPHFYTRFGFERARTHQLDNEYGVDREFMVVELRAGALDGIKGTVKYEPEFNGAGC